MLIKQLIYVIPAKVSYILGWCMLALLNELVIHILKVKVILDSFTLCSDPFAIRINYSRDYSMSFVQIEAAIRYPSNLAVTYNIVLFA